MYVVDVIDQNKVMVNKQVFFVFCWQIFILLSHPVM